MEWKDFCFLSGSEVTIELFDFGYRVGPVIIRPDYIVNYVCTRQADTYQLLVAALDKFF